MFFLFSIAHTLLDDKLSILKHAYKNNQIEYYVSGTSKQIINGTLQLTKPEYAFDQVTKRYDWCSNCGKTKTDFPWIVLGIKNQIMNVKGYFLRVGCCYDSCCCEDYKNGCIHCCLFSWNFQISNDNKTWKTVHVVEGDYDMMRCSEKTYSFSETYRTRYVRLIQAGTCYSDPPCISLNKIEIIGTVGDGIADGNQPEAPDADDIDDDISIIGHISKNMNHNN
ncbi:hypothetical protein TVAG_012940 [Trichomonas vaginalis G3]|uniref:F5/8 type C domain-containing protein n=1 Tax=Trichomonas vaginalis (strain ATCC PRA-98 / G3) TaxID=412133 RepID=A2DD50_TRIV3|nr:hypothetical protein TVAGG3_0987900 [Trichomonas vaginalis G3]EAY21529.1 hypothetical protein TVAG_012940 [Trichomonas vaginalis G3]KAI5489813.1 hypothetical protein TVAGG3_0987900 [Trichomonas vaginalis G3]|eukprot:XP_001582515.1 hypothetical protein [Trichomonas vaginalis G3]